MYLVFLSSKLIVLIGEEIELTVRIWGYLAGLVLVECLPEAPFARYVVGIRIF